MKNWVNRNYRLLINIAFLIPIIIVAFVSISHVTVWYDISNPVSWATYLSVGIEIAALSALAAISAGMGKKVYFPFIIVTLIQFIGNIFFSYQFIDINGKLFRDWVDLVSPLISLMGIESGDLVAHKRFLALFSGGLLPLISLSFLHMIVKFTEEDRMKQTKMVEDEEKHFIDDKILEEEKKKWKEEYHKEHNLPLQEQPPNDDALVISNEKMEEIEEYMKRFEKDYYKEESINDYDIENDAEEYYNSYDFDNEEGDSSDEEEKNEDVHQEDEEVKQEELVESIYEEVGDKKEDISEQTVVNDKEMTDVQENQEEVVEEKKK